MIVGSLAVGAKIVKYIYILSCITLDSFVPYAYTQYANFFAKNKTNSYMHAFNAISQLHS